MMSHFEQLWNPFWMSLFPASISYFFGELFELSLPLISSCHMACLPATIVEAGRELLYAKWLDSPLYFSSLLIRVSRDWLLNTSGEGFGDMHTSTQTSQTKLSQKKKPWSSWFRKTNNHPRSRTFHKTFMPRRAVVIIKHFSSHSGLDIKSHQSSRVYLGTRTKFLLTSIHFTKLYKFSSLNTSQKNP